MNPKKAETFPKMQAQGIKSPKCDFGNKGNVKRTTYNTLRNADDADAMQFFKYQMKVLPWRSSSNEKVQFQIKELELTLWDDLDLPKILPHIWCRRNCGKQNSRLQDPPVH